ncbi:MAG: serine/threonine protein phosphatase [Clostridia bacterium]|nr:serine/threonine protein phosphatase [Clostridia bacterium]
MGLFKSRKPGRVSAPVTQNMNRHPFGIIDGYVPLGAPSMRLYKALREAVPVIDAAVFKLVRLTGGFTVECSDERAREALKEFLETVPVGGNRQGIPAFVSTYFEQLLTFGTAVGEIVTDADGQPCALFNAPLDGIELKRAQNGFDVEIFVRKGAELVKAPRQELCLLSVLNPDAGSLTGNSLLKGMPFVSGILLRIFESIGANWDRVGNLRFAVTYNPRNDVMDRAYAKDRAMQVAREWGEAMQSGSEIKDFVAVGDVQIKVIGADNQILDSEIPVRQMLEQIVAKTGLPPFMLGLSWSSTERMSSQQADVLTSELEAYRHILTPVIRKICTAFLRSRGFGCSPEIVWENITLQDEVELSRARLYNAQAEKLESENKKRGE